MAEDDEVEVINFSTLQGWVECKNLQGVGGLFVSGKEYEEGDPKPLYEDKVYKRSGTGVRTSKAWSQIKCALLKYGFAEAIDNPKISCINSDDDADKWYFYQEDFRKDNNVGHITYECKRAVQPKRSQEH